MSAFSNSTPEEIPRQKAKGAAFKALSLIKQNAIKLEELEKEWSSLGTLREITFAVFLGNEDEANSLASDAEEEGFDTKVTRWLDQDYNYKLTATRLMEPTAEIVTYWEKWFQNRASQVPDFVTDYGEDKDGADFKGWSYPKHLSPTFFLKGNSRSRRHQNEVENEVGARDRTRVLFGQTFCKFEASNGWASKRDVKETSLTFELVPSDFVKIARRRRPSNPEPTASMFSQWLYSLYANAYGNDQDRAAGKAAEEVILEERRKAYAKTDRDVMRKHFPDWQLKHNGLGISQSDKPNYFSITDLLVGGEALRVLPDLIYENKQTGEIIIVEIKHSHMDIPTNLWPNIWGQLWCYAQIQQLRGFPRVTVVGEVWGDQYYTFGRGMLRDKSQYVYLRASVRRDPRALPYDRFFRILFDIYRGVA